MISKILYPGLGMQRLPPWERGGKLCSYRYFLFFTIFFLVFPLHTNKTGISCLFELSRKLELGGNPRIPDPSSLRILATLSQAPEGGRGRWQKNLDSMSFEPASVFTRRTRASYPPGKVWRQRESPINNPPHFATKNNIPQRQAKYSLS